MGLHGEFLSQRFVAEGFADVWYVAARYVVAVYAWFVVSLAEPVLFDDVLEAALFNRVFGQFAHVHGVELVYLSSDSILFNERLLCECELEWIVR